MYNENLEITYEELFEKQSFSNSDNFKELSKNKRKSDLVFLQGDKLTTLKIK